MPATRVVAAVGSAVVIAFAVAACGSDQSSGSASTGAQQQASGRRGFFQDPKVQACLKKQGVTLPSGRRRNGPPPNGSNGQPPTGTNGQPPTASNGQPRARRNFAQAGKLRKALEKCGVQLPNGGPNGPAPQGGATTGTTAS
jgi:hypothetical protein